MKFFVSFFKQKINIVHNFLEYFHISETILENYVKIIKIVLEIKEKNGKTIPTY